MLDFSVYDVSFFCAIGLVIILLQSDYFLTIKGYSLYKKYYAEYYTFEAYVLNPIWRKSASLHNL